jgi:hypothetical protein
VLTPSPRGGRAKVADLTENQAQKQRRRETASQLRNDVSGDAPPRKIASDSEG